MDQVTIEGCDATATLPEGQKVKMRLKDLMDVIGRVAWTGGTGMIVPDHVKAVVSRGGVTVWVYERPPAVYSLKWIANDSPTPFGPGAKYRTVCIGLPYLIVLAVFEPGPGHRPVLSNSNEAFFRSAPLKRLDGPGSELFYPALLNCSKFSPQEGHPLSWICTVKLDRSEFMGQEDDARRIRSGLRALLHCLLETGYNRSSEHHEESSWFTESRGVDERISTIENWQNATGKAPLFVLDVPWLKTGYTLGGVIERIFRLRHVSSASVTSVRDIQRILSNYAQT